MSPDAKVLARRASLERERLAAAFDVLEEELGTLADWRAYVRREPALAMGLAAVGGLLLGAATASRRPAPARQPRRRTGSSILGAGEAVLGSTLSAMLVRHLGGMLFDAVAERAREAYRPARASARRRREPRGQVSAVHAEEGEPRVR